MYTSFTIQNFRGFEHLHFDNLARINLIAGQNNVGKTSVLEALMLHAGHFSPFFLMRNARAEEPEIHNAFSWDVLFYNFQTERKITLSGQNSNFPQSPYVMEIRVVDIRKSPETYQEISDWNGLLKSFEALSPYVLEFKASERENFLVVKEEKRLHLIGIALIHTEFSFIEAHETFSLSENANRFSKLKLTRKHSFLIDILKILESRLVDLALLQSGELPFIYADIGLPQLIPLTQLGTGINRLANLILSMSNINHGVVCIDEIENGLHTSILKDVWKAIGVAAREFDVQIFATTHSLECIDAAHRAFSESEHYDFRYHRIDRRKSGETVAVTFDQELLQNSKEANFEVR